jgi:tetratricopeptide (TPR) repeat protein
MEQLAMPGNILLTPATRRWVEGLVQVNALGPIPVKGLTVRVEVFELVGATTAGRRLQAGVARGLTRFVGRESEFAMLAQALTNQYLGIACHVQGDYSRAIDCFKQTIAFLDGVHRHDRFGQIIVPAVNSRAWVAVSHAELGRFTEGRVLGDEGLQIAAAIAHPDSLINAYRGVGLLALRQGDLSGALSALERAIGLGQEADLASAFLNIAPGLEAVYTLAGRVAAAVPLLIQALEQILAQDMGENRVVCSHSLSEAHLLAGHREEASSLAKRALAFARAHQERGHQAYALRLLGAIAAHRGAPENEEAETHYQQAFALAEELGMRPLQAHCHLGLGTLYTRIGRTEQARVELSTAIVLYRAMDMTFWLPEAQTALAQVEGR